MHRKGLLVLIAAIAVALLSISPIQTLLARQGAGNAPLAAVAPGSTIGSQPTATTAPVPTATAAPQPTATPSPSPTPTAAPAPPKSLLQGKTWLTLYGRGWGIAPILGRLGNYNNTADMAAEVNTWIPDIKAVNGGKEVVPVIHLIYAMAIPCETDNQCLLYLDTAGEDIVKDYIIPAGERGWQVILDSQIGDSNPVDQVQRMIKRGYLNYPNVHVALDPEFHVYPGNTIPGIPIGQVHAADLNKVQQMLDDVVTANHLPSKKVLIVHQFGDPMVNDGNPDMILEKTSLTVHPNVDLVIDADGFGKPGIKVKKYDLMTDAKAYPFIQFRGIKLFFFNPHEEAHHADTPVMTWPQVFGIEPVGTGEKINTPPDVIVVA